MQILSFWVDLEDNTGAKVGSGPLMTEFYERTKPLSETGFFSFPVSPADPNFSSLAEKLVAVLNYVDADGTEQEYGRGIIEEITKQADDTLLVQVINSGPDITRELTYRSVRDLQIGDATGGEDDGPDQIMALAPSGWTITNGTTLQDIYVKFDGQSVLSADPVFSSAGERQISAGSPGNLITFCKPFAERRRYLRHRERIFGKRRD